MTRAFTPQSLARLSSLLRARRPGNLCAVHSAEASSELVSASPPLERGALYVVSTPIGNLEDITLRALRVLRNCDCVLAEDTRHTRALLTHFGLKTPTLSLHAHNEAQRSPSIIARLASGEVLALVSDAGTPGVSDPGALLIADVLAAQHRVIAVPGASALLTALVSSGLPTHAFLFCGFLPARPLDRRRRLQALASAVSDATVVLYVPPHKAAATLVDAAAAFGSNRRCCLAREMTKIHEECWRGSLADAAAVFGQPGRARGECVLLIEGEGGADAAARAAAAGAEDADADVAAAEAERLDLAGDVRSRLAALLAEGVSASRAAKLVAEEMGVRKRDAYAQALELAGNGL